VTVIGRIPWTEAEQTTLQCELEAMGRIAPELEWREHDGVFGWVGVAPMWPFERDPPPQLEEFLNGRRFEIVVEYSAAHPMVDPKIWPVDPDPEHLVRTLHRWHVNGDGSLCLLQAADDWDARATAAELVLKASGWFLEYLLMEADAIDSMTEAGIVNDPALDHLFVAPTS
jgi:hypothetical protein